MLVNVGPKYLAKKLARKIIRFPPHLQPSGHAIRFLLHVQAVLAVEPVGPRQAGHERARRELKRDELAEAARVVVPQRLGVPEGLQDRVRVQHLVIPPWGVNEVPGRGKMRRYV